MDAIAAAATPSSVVIDDELPARSQDVEVVP